MTSITLVASTVGIVGGGITIVTSTFWVLLKIREFLKFNKKFIKSGEDISVQIAEAATSATKRADIYAYITLSVLSFNAEQQQRNTRSLLIAIGMCTALLLWSAILVSAGKQFGQTVHTGICIFFAVQAVLFLVHTWVSMQLSKYEKNWRKGLLDAVGQKAFSHIN